MNKKQAFTLNELLIVVAIIAILAAIAVPNFLEAQVRAKVSRAKNDMRSIAVGLEAYAVDNNKYVPSGKEGTLQGYNFPLHMFLTTPIAYITSVPEQPFQFRGFHDQAPDLTNQWNNYAYRSDWHAFWFGLSYSYGYEAKRTYRWALACVGPDMREDYGWWAWWPAPSNLDRLYDPTNGSVSWGDIVRFGP